MKIKQASVVASTKQKLFHRLCKQNMIMEKFALCFILRNKENFAE